MSHRAYVKTVRDIAAVGWGKNFESHERAAQDLLKGGVDVTAASLLELVRRMNVVIDALARDGQDFDRQQRDESRDGKPENIGTFPGIKVGDCLYHCDELECGVGRYVVVAVEEGSGHCRAILADQESYRDCNSTTWAADWLRRTPAEALKDEAESDIAYHRPRLEAAQAILDAIARGEDVTRFMDGVADEGDDDS